MWISFMAGHSCLDWCFLETSAHFICTKWHLRYSCKKLSGLPLSEKVLRNCKTNVGYFMLTCWQIKLTASVPVVECIWCFCLLFGNSLPTVNSKLNEKKFIKQLRADCNHNQAAGSCYAVHSESIQTPSLSPHFITLQPQNVLKTNSPQQSTHNTQ
jgi:hypothetical protein